MNVNSPGSVTISGVVILQSPQPIDPQKGPRNIVFDANFCIVKGSQTVTMALLWNFAPTERMTDIQNIAQKSFQKAFVIANVHHITSSIPILTNINTDRLNYPKQYYIIHNRF